MSPSSPLFGSPQTCKIWGPKMAPDLGPPLLFLITEPPIWGSILAPPFRVREVSDPTQMLLKTGPSESNNFQLVACDLMTQHPKDTGAAGHAAGNLTVSCTCKKHRELKARALASCRSLKDFKQRMATQYNRQKKI